MITRWLVRASVAPLIPSYGGRPGVKNTGLTEFVAKIQQEGNLPVWAGLVAGSVLFQLTPLFTVGLPVLACWLSTKKVDQHAQKLASHRIYIVRQAIFLLKTFAGICWGAHPDVRRSLSLPPYPADPGTWRDQ